jgi:nitroreductase
MGYENAAGRVGRKDVGMNRRAVMVGGGLVLTAGTGAVGAGFFGGGSTNGYAESVAKTRSALAESPELSDYVRLATVAANSHNTQAWSFQIEATRIRIRPDFRRRTPVVDPDDHHLFVSLGCASENMRLAAAAGGHGGDLSFDASDTGGMIYDFRAGPKIASPLLGAVTQRQSTRNIYDGKPVPAADLVQLSENTMFPGIDVFLISDRTQLDRLRDIIIAANTVQMSDAAYLRELKSWLRYNPREALAKGDGLYAATTGNPNLPNWLGPILFDLMASAKSENDKYAKQIDSSSGVAVFVSKVEDREHWTMVGRACQHFALQATTLGLKTAFMNQPVEVAKFRPELGALVGMPARRPDIVMRFGYGPAMPYSPRRPLDAVLS